MDDALDTARLWLTYASGQDESCLSIQDAHAVARAFLTAHERIRELEAKQAWRPIETSPRDGSHFLALMWHGKAQLVVMASWAKNGVLYDVRETSSVGWDPRWDPRGKTPAPLWQPLPEPPK